MLRKLICALMLFFLLPLSSLAMPCHCFSARDFDPQEPAAADPYYLATSQNSFFSIAFDIAKKNVVFAKQKPRSTAEGLWVINWLSLATGKDVKSLQKGKKVSSSWREALVLIGVDMTSLPAQFEALLNEEASEESLARFVVDDLLRTKGAISPEELEALRAGQAANEETILASFLGLKSAQRPSELHQLVASGKTTWGTLLLKSGMKGRDMVEEIRSLLPLENKG